MELSESETAGRYLDEKIPLTINGSSCKAVMIGTRSPRVPPTKEIYAAGQRETAPHAQINLNVGYQSIISLHKGPLDYSRSHNWEAASAVCGDCVRHGAVRSCGRLRVKRNLMRYGMRSMLVGRLIRRNGKDIRWGMRGVCSGGGLI